MPSDDPIHARAAPASAAPSDPSPATPAPPSSERAGRRVLLADIGGTWARFATHDLDGDDPRDLQGFQRFRCRDFPSLQAAIRTYLGARSLAQVGQVCLALPGPVDREEISFSNNPWRFSRSALEAELGVPLTLINDFAAQAYASDVLALDELHLVGEPRPDPRGVRVVLGPGTGLGVAVRLPGGLVLPSEAGHTGFSPTSEHELDLMRVLFRQHPRISVERLVSGPGLVNLFEANRILAGGAAPPSTPGTAPGARVKDASEDAAGDALRDALSAPDDPTAPARIAELAAQGHPVARSAVDDFFNILASFSGDMALAVWATGGVYISGAVVRKLAAFLDEDRFRARFQAKGRFEGFCAGVAIGWMRVEEPGLLGCAARMRIGRGT